jgi:2-amino-4-hydroxy-6-hydroxymethyldihydropteridine diphosphokinase
VLNENAVYGVITCMRENTQEPKAVIAYLGLGSSLGEREQNLRDALTRLKDDDGIMVLGVSPIYESPHMGLEPGDETKYPPHLNGVAKIETPLTPEELLKRIRAVEEAGGRQRSQKWGPRTIDIDILLYGNLTLSTDALTIPHPGLTERAFVVLPLADLAPDLRLPDGRAIAEIRDTPLIQSQAIQHL